MTFADGALTASTPEEASIRFFAGAERAGATYLQTRLYRRPALPLNSATHWAAGGFVKRLSPKAWPGSAAFNYVCFECNPLLTAIRENRTRYRFSDFAPRSDPAYADYWDALGEANIGEALCATSYGADSAIASLHLGFGDSDIDPQKARAMQLAGLMLTERLMEFAGILDDPEFAPLTHRERDCLAFVADGKTTWEIGKILGIAEATARFHVDRARDKLDSVTRAQAVARAARLRLI